MRTSAPSEGVTAALLRLPGEINEPGGLSTGSILESRRLVRLSRWKPAESSPFLVETLYGSCLLMRLASPTWSSRSLVLASMHHEVWAGGG